MAKQSLETRLTRRKLVNRRGVWTTWQSPGSWQSVLLRASGNDDVLKLLGKCSTVGRIEENVTTDVLASQWAPPGGPWALLITLRSTKWLHLASMFRIDETTRALRQEFTGEVLQTGHQNTAGVTYVNYWKNQEQLLEFVTDGTLWETEELTDEADDEFGYTKLENTGFDPQFDDQWLNNCESAETAHQQLIVHLDAYVPGYAVDFQTHRLVAFHSDATDSEFIERIDLIHFGPQNEPEKIRQDSVSVEATAALSEAIDATDLSSVKTALANGASLIKIPDGTITPLAKACWQIELSNESVVDIIKTLLDAGAEPDNGGFQAESPLEIVLGNAKALPAMLHQVINLLIEHGADVNLESGQRAKRETRPLHQAAARGRLDFVILLLQAGADPSLTDSEGRTPLQICLQTHREMITQLGEENLADQHLEYTGICDVLKQAQSGTVPQLEAAQSQIDALTAKMERHRALMRKFGVK